MDSRQKTWLWVSAAIAFIAGFILVMNDSSAGWLLVIMGIIYIGTLTQPGQRWANSNPRLTRLGLIGITVLLVILVLVVGAVLLMK